MEKWQVPFSRKFFVVLSAVLSCVLICATLSCALAEGMNTPALQLFVGDEAVREASVYKGKKLKLAYQMTHVEEPKKVKMVWASSDSAIATVSGGTIVGKAAGEAEITCTATLADATEISASVRITVQIAVTGLTLSEKAVTVQTGKSAEKIIPAIKPEGATYPTVTWSSADEAIATVDQNGVITGVQAGKTTITALSDEPTDVPKKATVSVTVLQPVQTITLDGEQGEIAKGKTLKITACALPEDSSNKGFQWSSSDPSVATVSKGVVTAKAVGTAVITCTAADESGAQATYAVEVFAPVAKVTFTPAAATAFVGGDAVQLAVTVAPETAKYQAVTWTSSDETIAVVDENGLVSPIKAGKAVITATSVEAVGEKGKPQTAACTVTVAQPVTGLSITDSNVIVAKGKRATLTTEIGPEDASNTKLEWTTSDKTIATVAKGTVTAKKTGTVTITATTADGTNLSDSCTVTVIQAVTGLSTPKTKVAVTRGKTVRLPITVSPADATDKTVKWTSDNTAVATVDETTGVVTGKNVGSCVITANAMDGSNKQRKVTVYVEPVIPVDATTFTRSGYFGMYYEFAVTFKNLTKTRTIKYISFDLSYSYNGSTYRFSGYTDSISLKPGRTKREGWWDQLGYRLSYSGNFKVYLTSVQYSDGTWENFSTNNLIGSFY